MRIRIDLCECPIQIDDIRAAGVGRVQSVCVPPRLDDGGAPNEPLGICSHGSGHCICCNEHAAQRHLQQAILRTIRGPLPCTCSTEDNEHLPEFFLLLRSVLQCNDAWARQCQPMEDTPQWIHCYFVPCLIFEKNRASLRRSGLSHGWSSRSLP